MSLFVRAYGHTVGAVCLTGQQTQRLRAWFAQQDADVRAAAGAVIDAWADSDEPTPFDDLLAVLAAALGGNTPPSADTARTTMPEEAGRQAAQARAVADRFVRLSGEE